LIGYSRANILIRFDLYIIIRFVLKVCNIIIKFILDCLKVDLVLDLQFQKYNHLKYLALINF